MENTYGTLTQQSLYEAFGCSYMSDAFRAAVDKLQETDELIFKVLQIADPEDPERIDLDDRIGAQLADVDRLIELVTRHLPPRLDAVIALNALVLAVSVPTNPAHPDTMHDAVEGSVIRWLAARPDGEFREQIRYFVNRPHKIESELKKNWSPVPARPPIL